MIRCKQCNWTGTDIKAEWWFKPAYEVMICPICLSDDLEDVDLRIVTDTRFNAIYTHEIGTVVEVQSIDGSLVEYLVNGRLFYTNKRNLKYSKPKN